MVDPFIPDDCPDYLAHFMTTTSSRLGDIESKLDTLIDGKILPANPTKKNDDKTVTFKWILEKVALPILLSGGSAAVAIYAMMKALGKL